MNQEDGPLEQELIQRCKRGDRRAQRALYDRYARAMFNTCLRMLNAVPEAEDVLQESFIAAFRNLESYRYESTFGAWLKRIVVNRCISHLRKEKRMVFTEAPIEEITDDSMSEKPPDESNYDLVKIKEGIKALPDGYREILKLYLMEGYDHVEISEIMGISVTTSRSQYHRAKKKLYKYIKAS